MYNEYKILDFFLVLSGNTQKDRLQLDKNTDPGGMSTSQNTYGSYRSKGTITLSFGACGKVDTVHTLLR